MEGTSMQPLTGELYSGLRSRYGSLSLYSGDGKCLSSDFWGRSTSRFCDCRCSKAAGFHIPRFLLSFVVVHLSDDM